jgi:hypothetical protein
MQLLKSLSLCILAAGTIQAYSIQPNPSSQAATRRSLFQNAAAALVTGGALLALDPLTASASGGATAGKYT